jgi:hypothetical protein
MWHHVCRHHSVDWVSSHHCQCKDCGKHGHWFEEGFALWTMSESVVETVELPRSPFADFVPVKQAS